MFYLIFILFLNLLSSFEVPDIYKRDSEIKYYTSEGFKKKMLKINEDVILFYGNEGTILITEDTGLSWRQNFNGTYANFIEIINYNNRLFSITDFKELLISDDIGKHWKIRRFENSLKSICNIDSNIYILTENNSIYYSNNNGNNFDSININIQNVQTLTCFENSLIIKTNNNEIYVSYDNSKTWEIIDNPFNTDFDLLKKNGYVFLKNNNQIAKISQNNNWKIINVNNTYNFHFYPLENIYYIFEPIGENDYNPNYKIYKINTENNTTIVFDTLSVLSTKDISFGHYEHFILDIEMTNNEFIILNLNNRIIKSENQLNWTVVNDVSNQDFIILTKTIFFDKDNWYLLYKHKSGFLKTTNGGISYTYSNPIFDYNSDSTLEFKDYYGLSSENYAVKDENNLISAISGVFNTKYNSGGFASSYPVKFAKTTDAGNSWEIINLYDIQILRAIDDNSQNGSKIIAQGYIKNSFLFTQTYNNTSYVYELDEQNTVDTVFNVDKSKYIQILNDEINGLIWIKNYYNDSVYVNDEFEIIKKISIYYTSDNFENITLVLDEENDYEIAVKEVGSSIIFNSNVAFKYDLEENKLIKLILNSNYTELSRKLFNSISHLDTYNRVLNLENDKIYGEYFENSKKYTDFINLKIINDTLFVEQFIKNIDRYSEKNKTKFFINFLNDKNINYYQSQVEVLKNYAIGTLMYGVFKPIEEDLIDYYSSVEIPSPPPIWTYPPYPNPVKDRLKMKFYSAMMGEIAKLKVELIHIGTGRSYQINNFDLNIQDDYWGEIEVDVTGYIRGAYLINFKLGDSNKSEAIIIE